VRGYNTYFTRSHHHTSTDRIERIWGNTSTSSDSPAKQKGGQEVALQGTDEEYRLDWVVHAEVETAINDYTKYGGTKATVESKNAICGKCLLVNIDQAVELTVSAGLGVLRVVCQTCTSIVERVNKEKGSGTGGLAMSDLRMSLGSYISYTARSQVTHHPLCVTISLFLEREHRFIGITKGEVKGLRREVSNDIGSVTPPQRYRTLIFDGSTEAFDDTIVFTIKTSGL